MIEKNKYVVIDVETNGLNSERDDLLSISLYLPDENKKLTRYLPLDLNTEVHPDANLINGITDDMLKGLEHISQEELNSIISEYYLYDRQSF